MNRIFDNHHITIAISGPKQSGKNTIADHLVKEYGFTIVVFADPLREQLLALDPQIVLQDEDGTIQGWARLHVLIENEGWDVCKEKYPEVRSLMVKLANKVQRRYNGDDYWVTQALDKLEGPCVIPDLRFPNEVESVKKQPNGLIWRVKRAGWEPPPDADESETSLLHMHDAEFDAVLVNDATFTSLYRQVDFHMSALEGRLS